MKLFHYILAILTSLCLMVILFITSIQAVVYWTPGYFEKQYNKYQVLDALPPMAMEDLLDVTDQMMDYLKGDRADLHITTTMDGQQREFFNAREIAHMEDVRSLFVTAIHIRRLCLGLSALCLIVMALTKAPFQKVLPSAICSGTLLFFAVLAALAGIISTDFNKYFIIFHHIFFSNDLWILDPSTDMLINIVPEGFFMDTALRIAVLFGILTAALFFISLFLLIKQHGRSKKYHQ